MTYSAHDISGISPLLLSNMIDLETEYGNDPIIISRILKIAAAKGGRVVFLKDGENVVGHYAYVPLSGFVSNRPDAYRIRLQLKKLNITLSECTVPLIVHTIKILESEEVYLAFNKARIEDAVSNDFSYGIIGLNSLDSGDDGCYQLKWLEQKNIFEQYTSTTIEEIYPKVFLQRY